MELRSEMSIAVVGRFSRTEAIPLVSLIEETRSVESVRNRSDILNQRLARGKIDRAEYDDSASG